MNLFFDTSALIKKYIDEYGSDNVDKLLNESDNIYVSRTTELETISTIKRLLIEKEITELDYKNLKAEIKKDFISFDIIELNDEVIENSKKMIEKHQLKTLDSIQLGSLLTVKHLINNFIVCDKKLLESSKKEGLKTINPNERN